MPALPPGRDAALKFPPGQGDTPLSTGIDALDRALSGGLPRRAIVEIVGRGTSGVTALALRALAAATARGETCAWIDGEDAFDPASARTAGVELLRVLWVHAAKPGDAAKACDLVLEAGGFGLVVMESRGDVPAARLRRRVESSRTTLIVLSRAPACGTFAAVRLRCTAAGVRWRGRLFAGLEARIEIARARGGTGGAAILTCFA